MHKYQKTFKKYLNDLSARKPSPGGGSAAALAFCIGISLLEKSINYSSGKNFKQNDKIRILNNLKHRTLKCVDKDGEIFEKFMTASGKKRTVFLKKSNALVIDLGNSCITVLCLVKKVESGIKKSIISDFYTGLNFIRIALCACIYNLVANSFSLGRQEKSINIFKKYLKKA